jgi:hypothetical protein
MAKGFLYAALINVDVHPLSLGFSKSITKHMFMFSPIFNLIAETVEEDK